ncbi:hypothetical protein [Streptomyces tanashiensis]|uniref:hypothetical protein n=1 Tax=Streptomyces tanashiensis TaxID=67367 RepID=UPI0033C9D633
MLDAGLVEQAIARTESFDPSVDLARVRAHTDLLTAEFETFGVAVPAATRNITLMRALMVPIADEALSFAVDRIWVFVTNIDDVNDVNDALSFYKEAVDVEDFRISRIHRRAVQEGIPYLAAYRRSVDSGLEAYRRVLRLADDEQRPYLERYMTAYVYWHLHCRYRWQDVYPDLTMIDV